MEENYYVYVLLDPRWSGTWNYGDVVFNNKPFYIGKGKNRRIKNHLTKSSLKSRILKNNIIKAILNESSEPISQKVFENLSEDKAFEIEKGMIKHFGRMDENTGILSNHTDGGDGHSGCHLPKLSKRKKVYQYDLDGNFIREWGGVVEVSNEFGVSGGNISTSIKRGGTFINSIWSFEYLGDKIESKSKYKMPLKFVDIKQIDKVTGEVIKIFNSVSDIVTELNIRKGGGCKIYECINKKMKSAYGYKWEK